MPESYFIASQLQILIGKIVGNYEIADYEKHQKDGWFNKDEHFLKNLINNELTAVESKNAIILMHFKSNHVLLIGPEYGGEIRYVKKEENFDKKFHLKLLFFDQDSLWIRIKGFGYCILYDSKDLMRNYVFKRDSSKIKITDENEFNLKNFLERIKQKNTNIKSLLIGKDAIIAGIGNSLFQEIIYNAGIHPKEKSFNLSIEQIQKLYLAIKFIVEIRIEVGGKKYIVDIYCQKGRYKPIMDSSLYKEPCPICGTNVDKITIGGGINYFCPTCQHPAIHF